MQRLAFLIESVHSFAHPICERRSRHLPERFGLDGVGIGARVTVEEALHGVG
jgi:hypothetical protein